jgi:threonine dehydratase
MNIFKIHRKNKSLNIPFFTIKKVNQAYKNLKKYLNKIDIIKISSTQNKKVYLVDISNNEINCFKIRGAFNEVFNKNLNDIDYLCAASSGSFGISVAMGANLLKKKSIIFVPKNIKKKKILLLQKYNAKLFYCKDYEEAKIIAKKFAKKEKHSFIDGLGDYTLHGNATYIKELYEKKKSDFKGKKVAFVVPLGIGSLAIPAAMFMKKKKIDFDLFVVEPKNYSKFYSYFNNVKIKKFKATIADGAAVKSLPRKSLLLLKKLSKFVITLNEKEIKKSVILLKSYFSKKIEGAGALGMGGYLYNKEYLSVYSSTYIFVTGKN